MVCFWVKYQVYHLAPTKDPGHLKISFQSINTTPLMTPYLYTFKSWDSLSDENTSYHATVSEKYTQKIPIDVSMITLFNVSPQNMVLLNLHYLKINEKSHERIEVAYKSNNLLQHLIVVHFCKKMVNRKKREPFYGDM